ncbi:hypothetical protein [Nonomuraea diastatica]|nr:hypothetical protein [Nonomuraea diastatica]
MRMRIALSALVTAMMVAATFAGNVTAASAEMSPVGANQDSSDCC